MPELPEVETVRRGLHDLIIGRQVKAATSDTPKSFPNAPAQVNGFLIGATVIDVRRRAKVLVVNLSTNYSLVVHLKMTGQLVFIGAERAGDIRFGAGHPSDSLIGQLPDRSTRVTIEFTDRSHLYFNDQRKFGWMRLLPTAEVPILPFMQKVGPEPLEADFTADVFAARFTRRPRTSIKAALLDQTVVAGIGNIYADETLWAARVHPKRLVNTISTAEFEQLFIHMRRIMSLAIEKGGSTNKNYVNAEGKRGSYMDFAQVFRREGLACLRCGATIIKFKAAGRGTHICPVCQQL